MNSTKQSTTNTNTHAVNNHNTRTASCLVAISIAILTHSQADAQQTPIEIGLQNSKASPYLYVGRVTDKHQDGNGYIGSGVVIKPQSVLTCAHNLWESGKGWSSDVKFELGRYDNVVVKTLAASRRTVFAGYSSQNPGNSSSAFARDLGMINFTAKPMPSGGFAGYWANTALLTTRGYAKISLGYAGASPYTGNRITQSGSTAAFTPASGAWLQNPSYGIVGGMSGGPVFVYASGNWYVAAINVSSPTGVINSNAGVRALDSDGNKFIQSYAY